MGCILYGILIMAALNAIMCAGLNLESLIGVLCLAFFPALLFYGYAPEMDIDWRLKQVMKHLAAICIIYYLSFFCAILIIQSKYQSETRSYIASHPEYIFSTLTDAIAP